MKTKYNNAKTEYNGMKFDSRKEAKYAFELDMRKRANEIAGYVCQLPMPIIMNGVQVAKYIADFEVIYLDGRKEIVDVKGMKTPMYRLKKKLIEAQYGIKITEI
jgi:hypothetical protein